MGKASIEMSAYFKLNHVLFLFGTDGNLGAIPSRKNLKDLVVVFQSKASCASKGIGSRLYWEHLCNWIVV